MSKGGIDYRIKCLLEKDEVCVICSTTEHVVAHHLNGDRSDNSLENLVPMCRSCHSKVHSSSDSGEEIDRYTRVLPSKAINEGPYSRGSGNQGTRTEAETVAKVGDRGRITIPLYVRRALGIEGERVTAELTIRVEDQE